MPDPDEAIVPFTGDEPTTADSTVAGVAAIHQFGFLGYKPPENPPITDTVTPLRQPVDVTFQ